LAAQLAGRVLLGAAEDNSKAATGKRQPGVNRASHAKAQRKAKTKEEVSFRKKRAFVFLCGFA
jgi:catabolite regulation protein CreA